MGVAAYNRSSSVIRQQIDADTVRHREFVIMEIANSLQKYPDAGRPFGPIQFVQGNGGWWAECPQTGFGYLYPTLYEAVKRWQVRLVAYRNGVFESEVIPQERGAAGRLRLETLIAR
jgi:hypothetical protein